MKKLTAVVGLLVLGALVLWLIRNRVEYNRDVQQVTGIAEKLGYNQKNHLSKTRVDSFYYDNMVVLFSTQVTLREFALRVDKLGFSQNSYYERHDYNNLPPPGHNTANPIGHLSLAQKENNTANVTPSQTLPLVTYWSLRDSHGRRIVIRYLETPSREQVWMYKSESLKGSVVLVTLDRQT